LLLYDRSQRPSQEVRPVMRGDDDADRDHAPTLAGKGR
jgi:hypothetical protein